MTTFLAPVLAIAAAAGASAHAYPRPAETPVQAFYHFSPEIQLPEETAARLCTFILLKRGDVAVPAQEAAPLTN